MDRPRVLSDPLDAVRAWLEAPPDRLSPFLTGPLERWAKLREEGPRPYQLSGSTEIRHLALREQHAEYAICDCDATRRWQARDAEGLEGRSETAIGGPVVVGRDGGEWRVADYVGNGERRALECLRFLDGGSAYRSRGLTLTPLALNLGPASSAVVLDVRNDGARPVTVHAASLELGRGAMRHAWEGAYLAGKRRVEAGATERLVLEFRATRSLETRAVTVRIWLRRDRGVPRMIRFKLPFAGRRGGRPLALPTLPVRLGPRIAIAVNVAFAAVVLLWATGALHWLL